MKWIFENSAKVIGILSLSLIAFGAVYDWGYFTVVGSKFRAIQTTYDYITNAIDWMPGAILLLGPGMLAGRIIAPVINKLPEHSSADHRRQEKRRIGLQMGFFGLMIALTLLASSRFVPFPNSLIFGIFAGVFFLAAAVTLFAAWRGIENFAYRDLFRDGIIISFLFCIAFISGVAGASSAISHPAGVYKIELKGSAVSAVLLRTFEKGILVWHPSNETAELVRWEQIDRLSHIVASDKMTPACRLVSWFCPPRIEL